METSLKDFILRKRRRRRRMLTTSPIGRALARDKRKLTEDYQSLKNLQLWREERPTKVKRKT